MALRLYLIRHGETAANTEMRYLGIRDDPLTDHGSWQATRLAQALAMIPLTAVYTSPLQRSVSTAEKIAQVRRVELIRDARLREAAFGDWEGMSRAEVLGRSPKDAGLLALWESDPTCAPPGGESLLQVQERVVDLVAQLVREQTGSAVALVSHVGPIKALLATALEVPLTVTHRMFLDPATISVVDWSTPPVIRLFNSHEHMGWQSARWMRGE